MNQLNIYRKSHKYKAYLSYEYVYWSSSYMIEQSIYHKYRKYNAYYLYEHTSLQG